MGVRVGAREGLGVGKEYAVGDDEGRKVVGTRVGDDVDGADEGNEVGGDATVGFGVGIRVGKEVGK